MAEFDIECFQNEFLPAGGTLMNAVITVTAEGTSAAPVRRGLGETPRTRAEIIILDTSGSMKGVNLAAAKAAAAAAIDCLPDGVRFAVVSGNHEAWLAYPITWPLAVATTTSRAEAKEALRRLDANGGTAIGSWIALTTQLLRGEPGHTSRHPAHRRQERERVARTTSTGLWPRPKGCSSATAGGSVRTSWWPSS